MKIVIEPVPSGVAPGESPDAFLKDLQKEFKEHDIVEVSETADQIREVADAEVYFGWPEREVFLAGEHLKWIH